MPPRSVNDMTDIAVRLERVTGDLRSHVEACERATLETASNMKRIADKIDSFEKLPGKALGWAVSLVIAAAVPLLLQNYLLHQDTVQKASQAATAATQTVEGQQVIGRKIDALAAKAGAAP